MKNSYLFTFFLSLLVVWTSLDYTVVFSWFKDSSFWAFTNGIITIGTLIGVFYSYLENKKERENMFTYVPIHFKIIDDNNKLYKLKINLFRKDVTRAEIQGILSNYSFNSKDRYNINYLSSIKYLEQINYIQQNKAQVLIIELTKEELDRKFDLSKLDEI